MTGFLLFLVAPLVMVAAELVAVTVTRPVPVDAADPVWPPRVDRPI